ncbi:MAG: hypothetical protein EBS51_11535, partial [Planctomycetia bacterium]|nr:hypothetical protein [Planctomycetia bacterium]
ERDDLAAARPSDAALLRARLETHLAAVRAQLPTPNPRFDPDAAPVVKRGRRGGAGTKGGMKPMRRPG